MNLFDIKKGDIVSITGAGGKTSLMFFLSNKLKEFGSVLIATTTKIFVPTDDNLIFIGPEEIFNYSPQDNFIHIYVPEIINGKIQSAKIEDLNILKANFDYVLIESDGSCNKPLKGWKENEPVIPNFANKIISVIDSTCIGEKKSNINIHRLPLYTQQFPSKEENISLKDIVSYIDSSLFFKNSLGVRYLFFNKIESLSDFHVFFNIANQIKQSSNVYFGSIVKEEIFLFKNISPIILAAGFSKRFNGNKLNATFKGNITILEKTLKSLDSIHFKEKILVGRDFNFKNLAIKYKFNYVNNVLAHLGQSQSIIQGVFNASLNGYLFIPGDMPFLKADNILKIILYFQKYNTIILPFINGVPGAPVLFPQKYKYQLLQLQGDTGGREIIKNNIFTKCYFYNSNEFLDIDTKDELKRLQILED